MEPGSLTRTLKTMEEKGYITKKNDETDKRKVRICLTEIGKAKREVSKDAVFHFNEFLDKNISTTQKNDFFVVMETINDALSQENIFKKYEAKN